MPPATVSPPATAHALASAQELFIYPGAILERQIVDEGSDDDEGFPLARAAQSSSSRRGAAAASSSSSSPPATPAPVTPAPAEPRVISWVYDGSVTERHGRYDAACGVTVVDDVFDEGVLRGEDSGSLQVSFFGEIGIKLRTAGHLYIAAGAKHANCCALLANDA